MLTNQNLCEECERKQKKLFICLQCE